MYSRSDSNNRFVGYQTNPSGATVTAPPMPQYRNLEERGPGMGGRQRMSLLHPPIQSQQQPSMEYGHGLVQHAPPRGDHPQGMNFGNDGGMSKHLHGMGDSPSCKKLRLGDAKMDARSPLRIDIDRTRSGPAYNPQVEAISPTLPSESMRDESPLKSTKEELLNNISLVDREIAKTESQIAKLKKKKVELEEAANQPETSTEEVSATGDSVIRSLTQILYAENKKKAFEAHRILEKLGPKNDLPLYNQPSDTTSYHENRAKYASFKYKLMDYFRARLKEKENREQYMTNSYGNLSAQWTRKLEKIENNAKRRAREGRSREIFEKIFPELRKQREDKERFSRAGSRIKSDADLEEIMDGLHEQEMEDKKMRSYAVIPPILLDERSRKRRFTDRNGLMEDPMQEYKDKQVHNIWTDQEKEIFKEKYLQHPKNFGVIKSFLERKNVADCVQYYYLSKKAKNYRQLLRKSRNRTRSSRNQQQQTSTSGATTQQSVGVTVTVVKHEPNGVTTRQQKEQKGDQQLGPSGNTQSNSAHEQSSETSMLDTLNNTCITTGAENLSGSSRQNSTPHSEYVGPAKKKRKEESKELNELDTSEEENLDANADKGGPHNCVVCKTRVESFLHSRPIMRSQANLYGMVEEDITNGDRVCSSCRCKAVRRRFKPNQCPIPTCPSKRKRNRLRPFPSKWPDLQKEIKEAICAKYQIPPHVTKCCTACFNRISRRLSPNASLDTPDDPGSDTTRWTAEEIETIKKTLAEVGTDWRQLSDKVGTKSELQCRNFYFNFRKQLSLDMLVQEYRKKGGGGPPMLTDEEESGSTTSSCDEIANLAQEHTRSALDKKDDYDSSATVSAEEGGAPEFEKSGGIDGLKSMANHSDSQMQAGQNAVDNQTHSKPPQQSTRIVLQTQPTPTLQPIQQGLHYVPHTVSYSIPVSSPALTNMPMVGRISNMNLQAGFSQSVKISSAQQLPSAAVRYSSPETVETHEPMTVKDLMLATIEKQLRRNPVPSNSSLPTPSQAPYPPQSVSPTITSILKSQDRSHLNSPHGNLMAAQQHVAGVSRGIPPVSSNHQPFYSQHYHTQQPLYYSPKPEMRPNPPHLREPMGAVPPIHITPKDEYETLDLSMKKRDTPPLVFQHRPPSNGPPPAHQHHDMSKQDVYSKYPSAVRPRPQPPPPPAVLTKPTKVPPPPPLLAKTPAGSPLKDGSITHGTPMHIVLPGLPKYEGLLRPIKEGSITHGTPLDKIRGKEVPNHPMFDRSGSAPIPAEYYKRPPPSIYYPSGTQQPQPYLQRPPSNQRPLSPCPNKSTLYASEQTNQRQIIMNDYYTSQQMQQPSPSQQHLQHAPNINIGHHRMEPLKRAHLPGTHSSHMYLSSQVHENPYRQSSPPMQAQNQQRQGVIHRTNSQRGPVNIDSGRFQQHDAFTSLVDIAAAQPSLPVPKEEPKQRVGLPRVDMVREGLGKTMTEVERTRMTSAQLPPSYRLQPIPLNHVINESLRNRKENEGNRYNKDPPDTTLTAASLIDAIITHQINQPSPHDRQSPVPISRTGDRLFASFQRSVNPPVSLSEQPNQGQGPMVGTSSGITHLRPDESRLYIKNPQGGTWGDHIDLIISKDYASTQGSSAGTGSMTQSAGRSSPKKPEDAMPVPWNKSWKLRRALQHEKEQQQQTHNHPDERHITRVVQLEQAHRSSPKEILSKENTSTAKEAGPSDVLNAVESFHKRSGSKEGISALDYVKNRIVEVMRTENSEKAMETETNPYTEAAEYQKNLHKNVHGYQGDSAPSRSSEGMMDQNDSAREPTPADSPVSMVIDESSSSMKDRQERAGDSMPKYEPLTDEEN